MSTLARLLDTDNAERERRKSRCQKPPAVITTVAQALNAWEQFQKYRGLTDSAYAKYMQASIGTATQRKHLVRFQAYSDIADEWEAALDAWLRDMARTPRVMGREQA